MFLEATKGYDWFLPQTIPKDCTHSYYTFSVDYRGLENLELVGRNFTIDIRNLVVMVFIL